MMSELCIVLVGISILSFCIQIPKTIENPYFTFKSTYLRTQSQAIVEANHNEMNDGIGHIISFNANGNVSQSQTLHFPNHDVIVELGGGRLVEKE